MKIYINYRLSSEEFVSSNDLEFTLVQDNISEDDRILASINVKIGKLKSLYNKNHRFWMLIICLLVVSSQMNSIVPSIQIFSAMPYSPVNLFKFLLIHSIILDYLSSCVDTFKRSTIYSLFVTFVAKV